MDLLEQAFAMLSKHPLCDTCLGRQFALLGYNIENKDRGRALKLSLTLQASELNSAKSAEGVKRLKVLAVNGFSREAQDTLRHLKKRVPKQDPSKTCFLCEGKFQLLDGLIQKALDVVASYEFSTFLVGVELPVAVEEREDEFKATFNVSYGENIRHEFGRLLGKPIAEQTGKEAEYLKPDIAIVCNPFTEQVRLQVNPLFVLGDTGNSSGTFPSRNGSVPVAGAEAVKSAAEPERCILSRWRSWLLNLCLRLLRVRKPRFMLREGKILMLGCWVTVGLL